MAKNYNLPIEAFQYPFYAHETAREAGIAANHGYRQKIAFEEEDSILRKWQELMVNAPVTFHNILFTLFFIADMVVSWEIVRVVVQLGGFPRVMPDWIPTLLFCLLINGWAAVTAHFLGRGWSKEIQDWERWNFVFIKNRNQMPPNLLEVELRKERNKARFWGIFSAAILLPLIMLMVYYRVMALGVLERTNSNAMVYVMSFLPIAIVLGEIFTGDYVWYTLKMWIHKRRAGRSHSHFLKYKEKCGFLDQLAVQYTESALNQKMTVQVIGDLERSHQRLKYRSQQNDDYLDSFEHFRKIGFTLKYRSSGTPAQTLSVFGVLPNGAKTGDFVTDGDGKVTIFWDGDQDRLVAINIDGREYLGPFQYNGEHYLDLAEPVKMSSNGNGIYEASEVV